LPPLSSSQGIGQICWPVPASTVQKSL
jgi:hypothetical protein